MKEKLSRFWDILEKKILFQKKSGQTIKTLTAEVHRLESEVKLSGEVTENQLIQLDKKYKEKDSLPKEVRSLMKVVREKEVEIIELKEINDEVGEIPQNNIMNKKQTVHQCNACDKTFRKMS